MTDGTEPAQTRITIWGSTIELRPPVNRKLLLCNLLVTEWCSLYEIVISSDFPLYHQKTGTKTGTIVSSDWRDSTKAPLMQQANSKHPAGGGFPTPRDQFINNGFGLGGFLNKRGLNDRHCLLFLNVKLFRDPPTKILPELDDSAIGPYGLERNTNS